MPFTVIGQDRVLGVLRSAHASGRVAHAYLFCGTRGVGKTTMARLFAKELNGGSEAVDTAIMSGQDTDTIEIDAAHVRAVREGLQQPRGSVENSLGVHRLDGDWRDASLNAKTGATTAAGWLGAVACSVGTGPGAIGAGAAVYTAAGAWGT